MIKRIKEKIQKVRKEPKSLKKRLLVFMILCWVIPVVVFFSFTTISYRNGIIDKAENLMEQELSNIASVVSIRINEAISLSQKPSYEKTIENNWESYQRGYINKSRLIQNVANNLRQVFNLDDRFSLYAFYLEESETPNCYGSREGIGYKDYVSQVQENIFENVETESGYPTVLILDGKIYIIQTLYTTSRYEQYGMLVVRLNEERIFRGIDTEMKESLAICLSDPNELLMVYEDEEISKEQRALFEKVQKTYDGKAGDKVESMKSPGYNAYLYKQKYDNYHMGVIVTTSRREMYSSLYETYELEIIMLLLFLPLICYCVYFLKNQIQTPIQKLVKATKRMADGDIGSIITDANMPNEEFASLAEYFNRMSLQVKYLFDSFYTEKLARKDAQIQALQAQINPHFLNNTLEMMNWQARMSGDTVVSKMIEALGTVLDYRMNRANVKEIRLSEELRCTDAYFYIMSMRFGQRLQIEREIDEEILGLQVPPLILQPIVENAIVHGVEAVKNGRIELKVFHDEAKVYLRVINSGKPLTEEDAKRIQAILSGRTSGIPQQQGHHTSIGIRNVNLRIQLVYGDKYGLSIQRGEDDRTVSTITLPYMTGAALKEPQNAQNREENNALL